MRLGPIDRIAPSPIERSKLATSIWPQRVEMQWAGWLDDTNGIGPSSVLLFRDGVMLNGSPAKGGFTDATVQPERSYTYRLLTVDKHSNASAPVDFVVTTPPAQGIDARRVGVRPDGAYWGAAGEQIDMRSGNLNFSIPLLTAMSRNGSSVTFGLSYNSQSWRQDGPVQWQLGEDVGYGYGWKLLAGSILPVYSGPWTVHHYVFTDSTGAEYRLGVNNNNVWTSQELTYVAYDANTRRLYWPDGSYWKMDAESGGAEADAGTLYPAQMFDTNGNYITVAYKPGEWAPYGNSSARIDSITDVRAPEGMPTFYTTCCSTSRMTEIRDNIGLGTQLQFHYTVNQALVSPFDGASFGTASFLEGIYTWLSPGPHFAYNAAGEMIGYATRAAGNIWWAYGNGTYPGGQTYRQVIARTVAYNSAGPRFDTFFDWDADGSRPVHGWSKLRDASAGEKEWRFDTSSAGPAFGMLTSLAERNAGAATDLVRKSLSWTADTAGRPYVSSVLTEHDPGTANAKTAKTEQVRDTYGNAVTIRQYDYGDLWTPARTYTNTYLSGPEYLSRHIKNRLVTSTVTDRTRTVTLVTNLYDGFRQCDSLSRLLNLPGCWTAAPADTRMYDAANYGISQPYRGNVVEVRTPGGFRKFTYQTSGLVLSWEDQAGRKGSNTYEAVTQYAAPGAMTSNGLTTTLTWNSWLGLTNETDAHGAATSYGYDSLARLSRVSSLATLLYGYPTTNEIREEVNGRWTKKTLDGFARVVKVEVGDASATKLVTETDYGPCACSPLGKVKRVSKTHAPDATTVHWTTYEYDGLGRTTKVILPDGSTKRYEYAGNMVKVIDAAGRWKRMTMDAFGQIVRVNEPDPKNAGAEYVTTYVYDVLDRLVRVEMPRAASGGSYTQVRTWAYDANERLASVTMPETGTVTYTYAATGLVSSKRDARGYRLDYAYDASARVVQVKYFDAAGSDLGTPVTYSYDTNPYNGTFTQNGAGRLTAVTYGGGYSEMYSYTARGNLEKKRLTVQIGAIGRELEAVYTFDGEGRPVALSYPGGSQSYSYL